jgi:hypothetical protein
MCRQLESVKAFDRVNKNLQGILRTILEKEEFPVTNGTVRAIRQSFSASPHVPLDMLYLTDRIK